MITIKDVRAARLGNYIINTFPAKEVEKLTADMEEANTEWMEKPTIDFILKTVLKETGVKPAEFTSSLKLKPFAYARQAYCYLSALIHDRDNVTNINEFRYGRLMKTGLRAAIAKNLTHDPSIVTNNVKKVSNLVRLDKETREEMAYLEELIYTKWNASKKRT